MADDRRWAKPDDDRPWMRSGDDHGEPRRRREATARSPLGMPPGFLGGEDLEELELERRRRLIIAGAVVGAVGLVIIVFAVLAGRGGDPDVAELLQRGVGLQRAGRLEEAAATYREVIDVAPQNATAFFNLGVVDHTQGRTQEAAASYERVLAIDGNHVPALFNLAVLRAESGDEQAAIGLYERAVEVDPNHARALLNLGVLLLRQGEEERATAMIARAVSLDPSLQQEEAPVLDTTTSTSTSTTSSSVPGTTAPTGAEPAPVGP